jgi:hypothetical protein
MVTILPINVDEDVVREGLALAVAGRVRRALKELDSQAIEVADAGVVDRERWNAAFDSLANMRESLTSVLEYVKAFADQWPDGEEDNDAASS